MKIAILGKGTSAILTSLVCIKEGFEVEIFYDPDSDHLKVGESTTTHVANILTRVLDISVGDLVEKGVGSFKHGTKFINWGEGNTFRHHFEDNLVAFHFDTVSFNDYINKILQDLGVVYHAEKVTTKEHTDDGILVNEKRYDFLISCAGWSDEGEYRRPLIETVNSALLHKKDIIEDDSYTLHRAHEYGWEFGLPFPDKGMTKYGYLFNDRFVSKEDLIPNIGECRYISWIPRYASKLIQNKYEAYNGNRLFFLEPLQALSLYHYIIFAKQACAFLKDRNALSYVESNKYYLDTIFAYQQTLAFHYRYGSIWSNSYWSEMKNISHAILQTNINSDNDILSTNLQMYKSSGGEIDNTWIGLYNYPAVKTIHAGMTNTDLNFITL